MPVITEQELYEYEQLKRDSELAHGQLDWIGVPSDNEVSERIGRKLTLYARISWMNEWIPDLWDKIRKGKEEQKKWGDI